MALPKINTPTFELEIPSTKEKLTYRPFLVKEEKILLLAMEQDKEEEMMQAVKQIIDNCTFEKLDLDDLALFDIEFVFLRIRSKSVGEIVNLKLLCEDDGKTYADVEINLDDVTVDYPEGHSNKIELDDNVGMLMQYPQFETALGMNSDSDTENIFTMIKRSIKQIYDGDTLHERTDFTGKELDEFLESLSSKHFQKMQAFFETMPRVRHEVKFKNPKTKKNNTVTLEGLNAFFV
jgi:hypothetical protein